MFRPSPMLQRRYLCTGIPKNTPLNLNPKQPRQWNVKQVTKSNFSEAVEEIKTHIRDSHFVAVSLRNTGSYSAPWHRVLPVDTSETAYYKAKYAAERYQILQFAVCPFSIRSSKVIAHPYNFHLFPRDELRIGMSSYSFWCQSSYLTSMAREGFDFNACIYDGISYLSRSQESAAKQRVGNPVPSSCGVQSSSTLSAADSLFIERIKSRVRHWINACKNSERKTDDVLIRSLSKLVLGSEEYGSRPSLTIDVCSERQVQLTLEMLKDFSDDVVPMLIPAKGGGTQAVRVVLTSSKEDRDLFEEELQKMEEEQNRKIRGFREVIDLISTSQKPVVAHNSLNDFSFIHSKFLAPLPPTINEFRCSLRLVFPHILDMNHLMNEIGPLKKVTNLPAAVSYLKRHFFAPIDMEIPHQAEAKAGKIHGCNVLRISQLFAKLCSILKIVPDTLEADGLLSSALEGYANIFSPCSYSSRDHIDEDVGVWTDNGRKVSCEDLVFLWGFRNGTSAGILKGLLSGSREIFSNDFDVQLVDKSCAAIVFSNPGLSQSFLEEMDCGGLHCESLREMISEGFRATDYGTYQRVCKSGLWETDLADALDKALATPSSSYSSGKVLSEICWNNDEIINLDDL